MLFQSGAFSVVKVGIDRQTGVKYAIKIIDKSKCKGKEGMIETEISILKSISHENIIQLYEMYEVNNHIYLVMELVTGGELFDDIVKKATYSEEATAKVIQKILAAIEYLHLKGIAHRDLKPENLLLSNKTASTKIMISDFGLSKIFNDEEVMKTACGTPGYVAPEVLQRKGYGREVDLWSIGVITYILLCGYPPFYDKNSVELFKQIMAGKYEFDSPWWDKISEKAKDFIRNLLVLDTKTRYTARAALEHPFISDSCGSTAPPTLQDARNSSFASSIEESMGRPLGDRTVLDDSGIVSSLNSLNLSSEGERRKSKGKAPSNTYTSNNNISVIRPALVLQTGPKQIKFLSYNIFLRPPGIHNNASDHKNARLNYFGEHILGNFDVVCLQEMFSYGSSRQTRMVAYAKKFGYDYYVSSPSKGILNAQVDGGLMILSKYPIVKTQKLTYKRGIAIDRFSAKGAIYAKIAVQPKVHIHVFTTHLQSSSSEQATSLSDPSVAVRLTQIAVLKEFIDECTRGKPSDEPILLLGVLNTNAIKPGSPASESSDEYKVMKNLLSGETIHPALYPNQATVSSSGKHNRYKVSDLLKNSLKYHPVTYGDVVEGTKRPKETTLTAADDWGKCNCLDYIFWMNGINDGVGSNIIVKENATRVEKFLVDGVPFSQISDHYGVSTSISIS